MPTPSTIAVLGTLDTKGEEHAFAAELIRQRGHRVLILDAGLMGEPTLKPDISRQEILAAAGLRLEEIVAKNDRGEAVAAMTQASPVILSRLAASGKINGVISLGGGGGTAIGTAAMRALPIGFPKVMVSTLAGGNTSQYIGATDIVMFPSIVDVAGINRISRRILSLAVGAICGMVESATEPTTGQDKPLIVASMFGNTTECVRQAREILEKAGYEVLVFHATGTGGRAMESLIASGMISGVLDVTTTEWADEVAGGFLSAGPTRLEAAAKHGVPAVIAPGCLDMVNFFGPESVPARFSGRRFYQHNPQVTLMRTTPEECREIGKRVAEKINGSTGPVAVLFPGKGISVISAPGQKFHDPEADMDLHKALKSHLRRDIEFIELDCNINDRAFAETAANTLLRLIKSTSPQ